MLRIHRLSYSAFGSVFRRHGDLTAADHVGAIYIGLGDQFDDDRRLVRETTSKRRPGVRPAWTGASRAVCFTLRDQPKV